MSSCDMEALVHLRPAKERDLITDTGNPEYNKIYFERSVITGRLEGPYAKATGDDWIRDLLCEIMYGMVYVPHFEQVENGISCTMVFQLAEPLNIREHGEYKYNFQFYLMINDQLQGPFMLTADSNMKDIEYYFRQKQIYVLAHKSMQHFKEINPAQKAS